MTKRVEKFFGLEVKVEKDIEVEQYAATKATIEEALIGLDLCPGKDFSIYITRIGLRVTRDRVFKVAELTERLEKIKIRISVNPKDKELNRIFFLNNQLNSEKWLISPEVHADADRHSINIVCDGNYCSNRQSIELLVMTCVAKHVPHYSRKLKIVVTAHATRGYSPLLINANGVISSTIPYYLDSRVQFRLPFDPGPTVDSNEPGSIRTVKESGPKRDSKAA